MSPTGKPGNQGRISRRTQKEIRKGVRNWRLTRGTYPARKSERAEKAAEKVLANIPRRKIQTKTTQDVSLPLLQPPAFKTNRIRAFVRLFVWIYMIGYFLGGTSLDRILRRDSEARRAVRLRKAFEMVGGTFIKFGQQMAMRIDLLPWAYTVELSKMLDHVPPFPLKEALEIIERSIGKSWQEVFSVFDPDPVGSASIANVYQAILKNGDRVAVKIRRPGIGELFMADFKVFDWLLDTAEFLTIVRPGYTQNIRREFQVTLLEELDFVQEARFQDMFRKSAKKTRKKFFTAPKIYFELSGPEIIVQKYSTGMWLWEVMAGVEQKNPQALARMRELNIKPRKVAEHMMWVNYWGMQENLIFHADPHPANVIVRENSRLTFIDFGSCGSFNREQRAGLELTAVASGHNDAEGMARGTMKLFEPLPPVDVKFLFQEAEAEYNRVLTVFNSDEDETEWWERTSVRQWMSFFKFSRDNNIPVTIHALRMIRATLLYDTVAVRICKDIDRFDEYNRFRKFREQRAKKRIIKKVTDQFKRGIDDALFLRLEDMSKTGEKLMYRTQEFLSSPVFSFSALVGKWVFTVSMLIKLVSRVILVSLVGILIVAGVPFLNGESLQFAEIISTVASNRIYQVVLAILIITNTRQIFFRLNDQEH